MNEAVTPPRPASTRAALNVKSEQDFLADEMQAVRAGTWRFVARLLSRAPDADTLATLSALEDIDTSEGRIAMGWELMRQAALKSSTDDLEDEYFNLFIGLGRGELVPFGSWYLTGFLMEKPVALLRRDLDRLGIERAPDVVESEDHAAALAEAMAILIDAHEEVSLNEQRAFFDEHMGSWMASFFKDMQAASNARFYRAVGFFGESVVDFEQELLAMPA